MCENFVTITYGLTTTTNTHTHTAVALCIQNVKYLKRHLNRIKTYIIYTKSGFMTFETFKINKIQKHFDILKVVMTMAITE